MNKVMLSITNIIGVISLFIFINLLLNPWTKLNDLHTVQGRKELIIANVITGLVIAMIIQVSRPRMLQWLYAKK